MLAHTKREKQDARGSVGREGLTMTENVDLSQDDASGTAWYALTPEQVEKRLDVDPTQGLSAAKAAEPLQKNGPNALPGRADGARLEAVPGSVPELHADHPRRGGRRLDPDR